MCGAFPGGGGTERDGKRSSPEMVSMSVHVWQTHMPAKVAPKLV